VHVPSQVWGRDPQEAFEEPYEYGIQDQFVREAGALFTKLYELLSSDRHRHSLEDRSSEKALWLLAMDALDSLRDCLAALMQKQHRVAGKLFRDVMETMDLAAYFRSATPESRTSLGKWYADEIVPDRKYRDYVKRTRGAQAAQQLAKYYASLSRFTHRSHRAILDGYSRGGEGRLVHDRRGELYGRDQGAAISLVLPHVIASYYAMLANLALEYTSELAELGLVTQEEIRGAFTESLESETVPRRFLPHRWLVERLQGATAKRQGDQ
jgi:hypothetical protein